MKQYAIFHDDCEIMVTLLEGTIDSMPTVRDFIIADMDADTNKEHGYVESYPFWRANWEITGYKLSKDFDMNQILEITV